MYRKLKSLRHRCLYVMREATLLDPLRNEGIEIKQ
jgi:hypothetical protein